MFNHILVVCTGNICRSPMAEILLRAAVAKTGSKRIVESAGTGAVIGGKPTEEVIELLQRCGHDGREHRARQLTGRMLATADLVLTMDDTHNAWIHQRHPQYRGKVHKLLKWRGDQQVDDPYGRPMTSFERALEEIQAGIGDWMKRL